MGNLNCCDKKYRMEEEPAEKRTFNTPAETSQTPRSPRSPRRPREARGTEGYIFGPGQERFQFRKKPAYYKETKALSPPGISAEVMGQTSAADMLPPDTVSAEELFKALVKAKKEIDYSMLDRGTDR